MDLVKALSSQYMKAELPEMRVGNTVRVHVRIKEGSRERVQVFEGVIIARKGGGIGETITVRRVSYGVGCEKVFPVHSPRVPDIETVRKARSAALSCTTCVSVSARLLRSRKRSDLKFHKKRGLALFFYCPNSCIMMMGFYPPGLLGRKPRKRRIHFGFL